MIKYQSMPNQSTAIMETVIIFLLCIASISLEPHAGSENLIANEDHLLIKTDITKWWRKQNVTKPLKCKHKISKNYPSKKIIKLLSAPEIKSFPCSGNASSQKYHFKGLIRKGYLEGEGKLEFISDKEWSKLSHLDSKRKEIMALRNVCVIASDSQGKEIKEIIATFKNGLIHGLTKVTYIDKSFYIGHYKDGKAHGYGRNFDSEGDLLDAGGYLGGWKAGHHWVKRFGHLLYQKLDIVNDYTSPTLVFPIANDSSLKDPIAGNYFHYSGTLSNISSVTLTNLLSSQSDCTLDIEFKLPSLENYSYSLASKINYPLYGENEYHALCNRTKKCVIGNAAKLNSWIDYVNELLENRSILQPVIDHSRAPEILWQLRPESGQLQVAKSIRLISDIALCTETKSMTARVFGSIPLRFYFVNGHVKLNSKLQLNGVNDIQISSNHQKYVPREKSLGWTVSRIIGDFKRGILNGVVLIKTNVSTHVWATVKNGILHGPCVVSGITYRTDSVRIIERLLYQVNRLDFVLNVVLN